jgi:septum site-determining protein MinC
MARGTPCILLAKRNVTLLRGRRDGLELIFSGRVLAEAFDELEARLSEQPSFYRGASAVANVGATIPSPEDLARLRALLASAGVALRALSGDGEELERLAQTEGLQFERAPSREPATRSRTPRPPDDVPLSDSARSLVADFAGARNDIASRRRRGEASVRRVKLEPESARTPHELRLVETPPTTLYHTVTLRGGQVLHHAGNIVIVGDVNPGAELIATGDILVFGRLAGIAHAGAQGDENARIYAVDLAATQLRIATFIAADDGVKRRGAPAPKVAVARDARIVIFPLAELPT